MGGYHHTFGIRKNGENVATFCSFEKDAFTRGHQWHVHKGRLQCPHNSELRKVIVKVCRDRRESHKTCEAEMGKWDFLEKVLKSCPDLKGFALCRTYKAEVDEPCTKCFSVFSKKCDLAVEEGTPVIIQDRVEHEIHTLMDLDGLEAEDVERGMQSHLICLNLALASYRLSDGGKVITEVRGVKLSGSKNSGDSPCCIMLTSVTVHSETREFGWRDRGSAGISAFREVAERKLCSITAPPASPRRRKPSAPPLEEEEEEPEGGDRIAWRPEAPSYSGTALEPHHFMPDDSNQRVSEQYGLPIQQQQHALPEPTSPSGKLLALNARTMQQQMFLKDEAHSAPKQLSPRSVCPSQDLFWGQKMQQSTHQYFSSSPQEGCPTMQHMFSIHRAPNMQELHSFPAHPTKLTMVHSKPGEQTSPTYTDLNFGMPPAYESVVLGTERQGFPPPYSETCGDFPFH